jgi:adenylate cyclase
MKPSLSIRVPRVRIPKNLVPRILSLFRDARFRLRLQVGLVIALAVGLLLSVALFLEILTPLDPILTDLVYQPITPSGRVSIIAIDKKSLDQIGPWPWSRAIHAGLLERLSNAPPRVVAFDIPFPQPAPEDPGFAAAIKKAGNVILACVGVEAAAYPPHYNSLPQFDVLLLPTTDLRQAAAGIGHRLLPTDSDEIVRRVPLAIETTGTRYPALGIAAAQGYLGTKDVAYDLPHRLVTLGDARVQTDEYGRILINFLTTREGIYVYSYSDVFTGLVPASTFADTIVLIGGTSTTEPETYATPLTSGDTTAFNVEIQAGLAEMLVSTPPRLLQRQDPLDQIAFTLIVALIAGLTLPHLRPLPAAALTILYLLTIMFLAFEAFNHGLILRVLYPALALILTFGCIATFRYLSEERRRQFLTVLFGRYVPADSVAHVVDAVDRGELPLSGARRKVTVLYADLRGFAALSEGLAPEAVLEFVNSYLEIMLREIQSENGTVNKPMGDALVALWNAPLDQPDHAPRGLRAAINIRRSILRFQKSQGEEQSLNVGLGLATGYAVLGNISALGKVEYTLVGETVNVASRISAFASNNQILADEATAQAAPEVIEKRELTPVRIRGRKDPLPVWEIRDTVETMSGEEDELAE